MKKHIILTMVSFVLASFTGLAGVDAQAVWDKQCKKCHGEDGNGQATTLGKKLNIKDYTKKESLADLSDEDLFKMTKDGVADTKMTGYGKKLSDEEIQALVGYMRAMAK